MLPYFYIERTSESIIKVLIIDNQSEAVIPVELSLKTLFPLFVCLHILFSCNHFPGISVQNENEVGNFLRIIKLIKFNVILFYYHTYSCVCRWAEHIFHINSTNFILLIWTHIIGKKNNTRPAGRNWQWLVGW